ncbi:MarR family winged helix-turn-helix transcriptional regulator [Streptomyces milbemycinicus]|uniref:MarR family winged helix-turn-helix transcriptional regulator n=1 Tax=Streptomyces milbemycinicus TaxID=476552 RepID=UPI003CCBAB22
MSADIEAAALIAHCDNLSHHIVRVARQFRMASSQLLREVGLHPSQEVVMKVLWERGRLRQVDLVQLVGSDAATMTRTVRRLEQAGFVRRVPSPTDKRSVMVEPTAASIALRRQVEQSCVELEELITNGLTDAEQSQMRAILARLEQNIADHLSTTAQPPGDDTYGPS